MNDLVAIFEYILTELNNGEYYNPLQHTAKVNEMYAGKFSRNSVVLQPKENDKAVFHGVESFKDAKVLSFSYDSLKFKQPISLFVTGFSRLLKVLDIKTSELKKESEYSEDELKAMSKLKKVTDKNKLREYPKCIFFLPELNRSFASDGSLFALLNTKTNRSEPCAYNVYAKQTEETLPLKVDSIKSAMTFNSSMKITFDSIQLRFALKSAASKKEPWIKISQTYNLFYDVELLSKLISFVPKKQSTITMFIGSNNYCVHIVNKSGNHFGLMPACPEYTADINSALGIEEECDFALNYFDIANDIANESIESTEEAEQIESPESVEQVEEVEEVEEVKYDESVDSIDPDVQQTEKDKDPEDVELNAPKSNSKNNTSEPTKGKSRINSIYRYVNNIAYLLITLRYFIFLDVDIGIYPYNEIKCLKTDIYVRNKSSPFIKNI